MGIHVGLRTSTIWDSELHILVHPCRETIAVILQQIVVSFRCQ